MQEGLDAWELHQIVICRWNWVPVPDSIIYYQVPNPGNAGPDFHCDCVKYHQFLTTWALLSTVCAMAVCVSVYVCVCFCVSVSVTSESSSKMAKCRNMQTAPNDSPGTLVFWCDANDLGEIRMWSAPTEMLNGGGVGWSCWISTDNLLYLKNSTR